MAIISCREAFSPSTRLGYGGQKDGRDVVFWSDKKSWPRLDPKLACWQCILSYLRQLKGTEPRARVLAYSYSRKGVLGSNGEMSSEHSL